MKAPLSNISSIFALIPEFTLGIYGATKSYVLTLSQSLHLLNGGATTAKIQQGNVIAGMLKAKVPPDQVVDELYVRCLSREPTPKERTDLAKLLDNQKDKQKALDDVFWALLNTREFMFNH